MEGRGNREHRRTRPCARLGGKKKKKEKCGIVLGFSVSVMLQSKDLEQSGLHRAFAKETLSNFNARNKMIADIIPINIMISAHQSGDALGGHELVQGIVNRAIAEATLTKDDDALQPFVFVVGSLEFKANDPVCVGKLSGLLGR